MTFLETLWEYDNRKQKIKNNNIFIVYSHEFAKLHKFKYHYKGFFSDPSKVVSGHVFFFFKKIAFMSL